MKLGWLAVCVVVSVGTACATQHHGRPTLTVDHDTVLISDPLHVTVSGLMAGQEATLTVGTADPSGRWWSSTAVFEADQNGDVDPATMKPKRGSYAVADAMGLFWSMTPTGTAEPQASSLTEVDRITLTAGNSTLATTNIIREFVGPGVEVSSLRPPVDQFYGDYFTPPYRSPRKPGILVFGGSEGGLSTDLVAAQLAAHGYPSLALAYFREPGLPPQLRQVPLEYFITALHWLGTRPGVDPNRLVVEGASRGGEAALLLGSDFPDVIHGVVAMVPSAWVNGSFPDPGSAAWTLHGQPVPYAGAVSDAEALIPVRRINGPLLLECGGLDAVWLSCSSTDEVRRELGTTFGFPVTNLRYPDGGHGVGAVVPYRSFTETAINQGRTPAANPLAREQAWPRLLNFLSALAS